MAQMENRDKETFLLLKCVCVPLVDQQIMASRNADFFRIALERLMKVIVVMDVSALTPYFDYILFPLFHTLKVESKKEDVNKESNQQKIQTEV